MLMRKMSYDPFFFFTRWKREEFHELISSKIAHTGDRLESWREKVLHKMVKYESLNLTIYNNLEMMDCEYK